MGILLETLNVHLPSKIVEDRWAEFAAAIHILARSVYSQLEVGHDVLGRVW